MTVRTRLQPRFLIQRIAMIVICLVLGLWGLYDYLVKIPTAEAMVRRSPVYAAALDAIQTSGDPEATPAARRESAERARATIQAAIDAVPEGTRPAERIDPEISPRDEAQWATELALMASVVTTYVNSPPGAEIPEQDARGADLIRSRKNLTAAVTPPSKFDRLTQWFFILCLPFVPWYSWTFAREARVVHRLEDDGSFHGPSGRWGREEIADIDMSQWMRKSIAFVVHADGRREKLDDYVHRDVDRIVGAIAHRMYPQDWTEEAKAVRKGVEAGATTGSAADAPTTTGTTTVDDAAPAEATAAREDSAAG
jgi:hypothetical protein